MVDQISAVIVDIEGTIGSISFVKEVLFPYARKRVEETLRQGGQLVEEAVAMFEKETGKTMGVHEQAEQFTRWIDEDKKSPALKKLQGVIWEKGFRSGEFTGHLYPDAYELLLKFKKKNIPVYVYSSGSVQAQLLYFAHSDFGDILNLFAGHFDTSVGGKKDQASYVRILKEIKEEAHNVIFFSDIVEELDAAKHVGINTMQLQREGEVSESGHPAITSFEEFPDPGT